MDLAILSDVHGNLVALEAVSRDLEAGDAVDEVICLGDVAAMGPDPCGCIDFLRRKRWTTLMGNTDAWLLGLLEMPKRILKLSERAMPMAREAVAWATTQLQEPDRAFLRGCDPALTIPINESEVVVCCHGSPRSFQDRMLPMTPSAELDHMLGDIRASIVVSGHTHIPMLRRHRDMLLVNVGSVGLPLRDRDVVPNGMSLSPRAQYVRLTAGSGCLSIEFREVTLDLDRVRNAAWNAAMPDPGWWASMWDGSTARRKEARPSASRSVVNPGCC